ncbi:hypothetical protein F7Q99_26575 [Streptomyces kaniharaensis]|uniref:Uncharacterized protein n=1 Tax=Streptomyces kaniharaensis TaxID=212423 RepID=A0A6N7KVR4_9ACTN|nr:hypothetical protein [Streptomyces kaniharaensis]MQS15732.1 hypothetical protein [Streptomyces kaniharaensis]
MGSAVWARVGGMVGGKTVAVVTAGALVTTGAVGAGIWWAVQGPHLQVVQRNAQVALPPGGQQAAVAGCAENETALGGGYAVEGAGYASISEFVGGSAWLAAAYNPGDAPATLTVYALCVNARVELAPRGDYTQRALAFRDRLDKVTAGDDGQIHDLTTDGPWAGLATSYLGTDSCTPGYTMTGLEFRAGRTVPGHPATPLPLDQLSTLPDATGHSTPMQWIASVNPGTELSTRPYPMRSSDLAERRTRIEDPQPPQANYAVGVRAICAKLKDVSVVTAQAAVTAGGAADLDLHCPRDTFAVGGGFRFTTAAANGTYQQRYLGDGLLYASADGPAPGRSGHVVKDWHLTGRNGQQAGTGFRNSVWIEHSSREELTGNGYFDSHPRGADDQELRGTTIPAGQQITGSAVCATIDAKPTEPGPTAPPVSRPDLPPVLDLPPLTPAGSPSAPTTSAPAVTPSASTPATTASSPTASTPATTAPSTTASTSRTPGSSPRPSSTAAPTPTPSSTTAPTPTQGSNPPAQPQAPAVSIEQPLSGATLRRGCEETFTGTARTQPGNQPITDPKHTVWQITGPNGPVTIGTGSAGRFTVPLLADGNYALKFTATDPANNLTAHTETTVRITGCLR